MASESPENAGYKGTGWSFPPRFARGGAGVELVSGDEDILQSLRLLLATEPGERVMRANFGCDLASFVFEEVDQGLLSAITRMVSEAILKHEPRVVLESVDVNRGADVTGEVVINIRYRSRLTNSRYNMVYPFYLREAAVGPTAGA